MKTIVWGLALLSAAWTAAGDTAPPAPLPCAHAHNDYEHQRPLLDALDCGFCSVEADVWLVDGQLLVAHNRSQTRKERSLQSLYLDPLRERVKKNGGRVYPGGPSVTLLIDFKTDATTTYRALNEILKPYETILTAFHSNRTETNAITVIISGNRPLELMQSEPDRLAAYDGRLADLEVPASPHYMPLISDNWTTHFQWRGRGPLPEGEREKLKQLVAKAHQQGKRVRLWAAPDLPAAWRELLAAGVDLINTDDMDGFRRFFLDRSPSKTK